jgi:hypothetical protein
MASLVDDLDLDLDNVSFAGLRALVHLRRLDYIGARVTGAEVGFLEFRSNGWVLFKGLGNGTMFWVGWVTLLTA